MSTRWARGPRRSQAMTPASVSILDRADLELAAQPVGDAARAVAASAGEGAVVVVYEHSSGGRRCRARTYHSRSGSCRRCNPCRSAKRLRTVHRSRGTEFCCRRLSCARPCARRADGGRPSPQSPFAVCPRYAGMQARRAVIVSAPSPRPPRGSLRSRSTRRRRGRRPRPRRTGAANAAPILERRKRALTEISLSLSTRRQARWALTPYRR